MVGLFLSAMTIYHRCHHYGLSSMDDDSESDTGNHTATDVIGVDESKKLKKKTRQSSDGDVTATQQECTSVVNKLNKKFTQLKNNNSNYSFTDFWKQIVKFHTHDAEYARARRLMNLELQPGVQLFYKTNKDLIHAFLNDQSITSPSQQRHSRHLSDLPSSSNHGNSNTTATTPTLPEDHNNNNDISTSNQIDPTMNKINQFHSRVQASRIFAQKKRRLKKTQ